MVAVGRRHRLLRIVREQEADIFARKLGLVVRSGPAQGLRLLTNSSWGKSDLANKVMGLYEQPVHSFIGSISPIRRVVCIGAADGYYGVGLVVSGKASSATCFEMSDKGREVIEATAAFNGVSHKVEVLGKADDFTIKACLKDELSDLFLIDIEGGEYDLLSAPVLESMSRSHVLVELHPHLVCDGERAQCRLLDDAAKYFHVSIINDDNRILPDLPELKQLSDDQRWLMCSEAREHQMRWLALTPRKRHTT